MITNEKFFYHFCLSYLRKQGVSINFPHTKEIVMILNNVVDFLAKKEFDRYIMRLQDNAYQNYFTTLDVTLHRRSLKEIMDDLQDEIYDFYVENLGGAAIMSCDNELIES